MKQFEEVPYKYEVSKKYSEPALQSAYADGVIDTHKNLTVAHRREMEALLSRIEAGVARRIIPLDSNEKVELSEIKQIYQDFRTLIEAERKKL